ncbi:MAG: hypothetical protein F6K47_08120 [Symploca sp. SIO2E6]|nr:hypothetical protein [Symploca sp. SIO2E6]
MRQVALIGLLSFLTLLTGSCTNDQGEVDEQSVAPSPSVSPSPQASPSPSPFEEALEPAKPQTPPAAAGLISSLPPEERIKQVAKGRNDPFAAIPVQPEVKVDEKSGGRATSPQRVPGIPRVQQPQNKGNPSKTQSLPQATKPKQPTTPKASTPKPSTPKASTPKPPTPKASTPKPSTPKASTPKPSTPKAPTPKPSTPSNPSPPSATTPNPSSPTEPEPLSEPTFIPQLPEPPEATLARQIKVEGVVQVDEQPSAIVKVPNQPSQYVKEGQRLSNGQVLVKRIEANRGPTPIVILEENGIEVAIRVGEEPIGAPQEGGSQTALIPSIKLGVRS